MSKSVKVRGKEIAVTVEGLEAFVARGLAAQDAANGAVGRPTAAEVDHEKLVGLLRGRLERELAEAVELTRRAARTLDELMSDAIYDVEYSEGVAGRDVEHFIDSARRSLSAARAQAVQ
jgi:hypothetical protein